MGLVRLNCEPLGGRPRYEEGVSQRLIHTHEPPDLLPNTIDSTAGLPAVSGSESAAQDYRNVSTSAGLETRMSWTPSGVKPLYSILGAMWSSMYE